MRAVGRRRAIAADAIDDALQVAVANRLAMLAHLDDRSIDLRDLLGLQLEAERLASPLHGVTPRMTSEDELIGRLTDVLWPHDFVRALVLQHAVLVDACFVRERVAADDGLVRLHRLLGHT